MIIDDDLVFVKKLTTLLTLAGYEVAMAKNGWDGLSQIIQFDPDLVILDTMMPGMSSLEFMQKYEKDGKMREIPLILVSERANMLDFFKGLLIKEFFTKPLDTTVFLAKVAHWTGTSATQGPVTSKKRVILAGVEKYVLEKIKDFFLAAGWDVILAKNDKEVYDFAAELCPDAILCEYWDPQWEGSELDPKALAKHLSQSHVLERINFQVYCPRGPVLDAIHSFSDMHLIKYVETQDLLKEIGKRFGIPD